MICLENAFLSRITMTCKVAYDPWSLDSHSVHLITVCERLQRLGGIRTKRTLQYCHAYLLPVTL